MLDFPLKPSRTATWVSQICTGGGGRGGSLGSDWVIFFMVNPLSHFPLTSLLTPFHPPLTLFHPLSPSFTPFHPLLPPFTPFHPPLHPHFIIYSPGNFTVEMQIKTFKYHEFLLLVWLLICFVLCITSKTHITPTLLVQSSHSRHGPHDVICISTALFLAHLSLPSFFHLVPLSSPSLPFPQC